MRSVLFATIKISDVEISVISLLFPGIEMPGFEMSRFSPGYRDPWLRSLMFLADRTWGFEISHIEIFLVIRRKIISLTDLWLKLYVPGNLKLKYVTLRSPLRNLGGICPTVVRYLVRRNP